MGRYRPALEEPGQEHEKAISGNRMLSLGKYWVNPRRLIK